MMFAAWLASLVALLTGLAMLKDTYLGQSQRSEIRAILSATGRALRTGGPAAIDRRQLGRVIRFFLLAIVLVVVVASSGVCVFLPGAGSRGVDVYDVALRGALAAFLAMQTPCPWWRYILHGQRRSEPKGDRHVH